MAHSQECESPALLIDEGQALTHCPPVTYLPPKLGLHQNNTTIDSITGPSGQPPPINHQSAVTQPGSIVSVIAPGLYKYNLYTIDKLLRVHINYNHINQDSFC